VKAHVFIEIICVIGKESVYLLGTKSYQKIKVQSSKVNPSLAYDFPLHRKKNMIQCIFVKIDSFVTINRLVTLYSRTRPVTSYSTQKGMRETVGEIRGKGKKIQSER